MAGVQGLMTLLLTVSMLWASLFVSETHGQTTPCSILCTGQFDPVCGSDGRTYRNQCGLDAERICRNPSLFRVYTGPCIISTTPCETDCTLEYRPVCGSDGRTYGNECALENEKRCRDPSLYKLFDGVCSQTTTPCGIPCPAIYQPVCGSNFVTYGNDCQLQNARTCRDPSLYKLYDGVCSQTTTPCDTPCPAIYQPVCGSNGRTYGNDCQLQTQRRCRDPSLYKLYDGVCTQTTSPCGRVCTAIYQPVCGSDGTTYGNDCQLQNARICRDPSLYKLYDGVCTQTTSPCGRVCTAIYQPVCGSDGTTYGNDCELQNARICRDPFLYKQYDGPCRATTTPCDMPCPKIYLPVCGSDWKTYGNQCELDNERRCRNPHLKKKYDGECRVGADCDKPCPKHHQPVCGSDLKTYDNYCLFEIAQCKRRITLKKENSPCSSAMKPTASTLMAMMAFLGSILLVIL